MQTRIVDVTDKPRVRRSAEARGALRLRAATVEAVRSGRVAKGDVLATARVAALTAVKETSRLLPLCHPIPLTAAEVAFELAEATIGIRVRVTAVDRTGVEMEALTGATLGLLCVWDMVKALEKDEAGQYPDTALVDVHVVQKTKEAS